MGWSLYTNGQCQGPPVQGVPAQFEVVERVFAVAGSAAEDVIASFEAIKRGNTNLVAEGLSADRLRTAMADVSTSLDDLPRVSRDVERIFRTHATYLETLHRLADEALARAKVAWERQRRVEDEIGEVGGELGWLDRQLGGAWATVEVAVSPELAAERDRQQQRRDSLDQRRNSLQAEASNAQGDLNAEINEWHRLREHEVDREETTRVELERIDLGALADPGIWQAAWETVSSKDFWVRVLWELRDALEKILLVAAVIGLFFGGAFLLAVVLILAVAKLGTEAILYGMDAAHPDDPTRKITRGTLALSALAVLVAGASYAHAGGTAGSIFRNAANPKSHHLTNMGDDLLGFVRHPGGGDLLKLRKSTFIMDLRGVTQTGHNLQNSVGFLDDQVKAGHRAVGYIGGGTGLGFQKTDFGPVEFLEAGEDLRTLKELGERGLGIIGFGGAPPSPQCNITFKAIDFERSIGYEPTLSGRCRPVLIEAPEVAA